MANLASASGYRCHCPTLGHNHVMSETFDQVVENGTVVRPEGSEIAAIGIRDGRIAAIGDLQSAKAAKRFDATGLHVLPGVIDSQVHFREPGNEHKEDLESGMRSAIAGGVTTIFEMPNTAPPTTTADALAEKVERALGRASCDFGFFVGASAENAKQLGELETLPGCVGVKIFMGSSTGSLLVADDETLETIFRSTKRRIAVHCEDEQRLRERRSLLTDDSPPRMHPVWRDEESAFRATRRLVAILEKTNRCAHILHVTTSDEIQFLSSRKAWASVECTPQHLTLHGPDCYNSIGSYAQMNPPIRDLEHREALWRGIADGVVDVIGSDHAPHTREEKDRGYPNTPAGMPGVQTLVPIMLNHVNAGRMTLEKLVAMVSKNPATLYGMKKKGQIALGFDADLTLVDMEAEKTIEDSWIESRCGWTPYDGKSVQGWPMATIVRGKIVMANGELLIGDSGQPVEFEENPST